MINEHNAAPIAPRADVPENVMLALDRMCTPLDESRLSGATAAADAHCMKLIRDYVLSATRADADTANIYERFDTWMKGPHARVQTMLDAFAAGASNERADVFKCDGKLLCRHCLAPVVPMGDGYEHRPERADAEKDAALTEIIEEFGAGDWINRRTGASVNAASFARAILAAIKNKEMNNP
jgi:hypothetical protein